MSYFPETCKLYFCMGPLNQMFIFLDLGYSWKLYHYRFTQILGWACSDLVFDEEKALFPVNNCFFFLNNIQRITNGKVNFRAYRVNEFGG